MSDRYSRHRLLAEIGDAGQERIRRAAVVVVGCGALGSTQAQLLCRAGVGRLRVIDRDLVELSNLQRQLLYDEEDVRAHLPKAVAAAAHLRRVNAEVAVEEVVADVGPANLERLTDGADVVLDATDNVETRYALNDACVKARRPWVYGGVLGVSGLLMAVVPGETACLRCLFPEAPPPGTLPTCDTLGVLNVAPVVVAALQVAEALKLLVGARPRRALLSVDVWSGAVRPVEVARDPACPCCGAGRYEFLEGALGSTTVSLCGRNAVQVSPAAPVALDLPGLARRLAAAGPVEQSGHLLVLDVEGLSLVVFPDGRVLVRGTSDTALARGLVARYVGV